MRLSDEEMWYIINDIENAVRIVFESHVFISKEWERKKPQYLRDHHKQFEFLESEDWRLAMWNRIESHMKDNLDIYNLYGEKSKELKERAQAL